MYFFFKSPLGLSVHLLRFFFLAYMPITVNVLLCLGLWSLCWACSFLLCCLFCRAVCFVSCLVFVLFLCFSFHLALLLPRFGRGRLVLVCSVCSCLVLSCFVFLWDGLRFVIVALPGLFSYLFCSLGKAVVNDGGLCDNEYTSHTPNKSKATSSLLPRTVITILDRTHSNSKKTNGIMKTIAQQ